MMDDPPKPALKTRRVVPRRKLGSLCSNDRLPATVPVVGLGCSSFSSFFWKNAKEPLTIDTIHKDVGPVPEWIDTIHYAIDSGITLLDTAPWYGHGTSEVVVGYALQELFQKGYPRANLTINTKVGRYEADPQHQFDYSYQTTKESVQRSIQRLKCNYIDVLQLHDPEFAPSLDVILEETLVAMAECQREGLVKAIGLTGYPLELQYEILQRSPPSIQWDQCLVYGHFNLHDTSLFHPLKQGAPEEEEQTSKSFAQHCQEKSIALLAAAPLSMGLLTHAGPPEWHPAGLELKEASRQAAQLCTNHNVNISTLATLFALSENRIPCTILGMKDKTEVDAAVNVACRISSSTTKDDVLQTVLTQKEWEVLQLLQDNSEGPFARVWASGQYKWDGKEQAEEFWKLVPGGKQDADRRMRKRCVSQRKG